MGPNAAGPYLLAFSRIVRQQRAEGHLSYCFLPLRRVALFLYMEPEHHLHLASHSPVPPEGAQGNAMLDAMLEVMFS
jgi:hypothetical protein